MIGGSVQLREAESCFFHFWRVYVQRSGIWNAVRLMHAVFLWKSSCGKGYTVLCVIVPGGRPLRRAGLERFADWAVRKGERVRGRKFPDRSVCRSWFRNVSVTEIMPLMIPFHVPFLAKKLRFYGCCQQ